MAVRRRSPIKTIDAPIYKILDFKSDGGTAVFTHCFEDKWVFKWMGGMKDGWEVKFQPEFIGRLISCGLVKPHP